MANERRPGVLRGQPDAVPIDQKLGMMGYSTPEASVRARRALEEAGITNPRKKGIHPTKRRAVRTHLRSHFVRVCGSIECADAAAGAGREPIQVRAVDCEICAGRTNLRAASALRSTFRTLGLKRLLVVGGGPGTHDELRNVANHHVRIDVIDGTARPDARRARALANNADVIVIWGSTILPHAVSGLVAGSSLAPKAVTITRRGVPALVAGVVEHCRRREAQHVAG